MHKQLAWALVAGGTIAGVCDLFVAALINRVPVELVMRFVASGLWGPAALKAGWPAAAAGLLLQAAMSIAIAFVYGVASLWLPVLVRHWVACGLLFGAGVFVVMNFVVMPLSAIGRMPRFPSMGFALMHFGAMLAFGLALAFATQLGSRQAAAACAPDGAPLPC